MSAVANLLAPLLNQSFNTVRERLRDTYREADAKAGNQRAELDMSVCWAPWLAWVLDGRTGKQWAIALDATSLGDRFVVLAVSVLYRGCAVPVAWKVLKAQRQHAWKSEWLKLLEQFNRRVPRDGTVIVLTDRGLYAKWLYRAIVDLGWHPFLRVKVGGTFRPEGERLWRPFKDCCPKAGMRWQGRGIAFSGSKTQLRCIRCWPLGARAIKPRG